MILVWVCAVLTVVCTVWQVAALVVLFLCMNTAGIFISYLSDRAQRQAFLETRRCIEARLRLETENQRQVTLSALNRETGHMFRSFNVCSVVATDA